jgi:hypothetical protein
MYNTILNLFTIFVLMMITLLVSLKRRQQVNDAGKFLSLYYWCYLQGI